MTQALASRAAPRPPPTLAMRKDGSLHNLSTRSPQLYGRPALE